MTTYRYHCAEHGGFDRAAPLGAAPERWTCPECGADSRREFTAPMLALAPRALVALVDRTERSRDEPDVVVAPPPRPLPRRRIPPANPALRRLPRP